MANSDVPVQFVGIFASALAALSLAFVQRMLEVERAPFDRWFVHFQFELALERALFVAWLEIGPPVANHQLVALEHFDLIHRKIKKERRKKKTKNHETPIGTIFISHKMTYFMIRIDV